MFGCNLVLHEQVDKLNVLEYSYKVQTKKKYEFCLVPTCTFDICFILDNSTNLTLRRHMSLAIYV